MLTLLIDTCTERGILAIFKDDEELFSEELPFGLQNSKALLPALDHALKQLNLTTANFNLIAVASGPGSYTGIRVGVATAKALAFAHRHPLVGVSTLFGLIPPEDGHFAALIDAKVGGAYYLLGKRTGTQIEFLSLPDIAPLEQIVNLLQNVDVIVTPVAQTLPDKMRKLNSAKEWRWIEKAPEAIQMVKMARQSYQDGQFSTDGQVEILYLRKTQAELDRETRPDVT